MKGNRAERTDYLLLHEFHKLKYITPDKAPFVKPKMSLDGDQVSERSEASEP
tara:strand:+ start:386 stop:541 length:156 start_codon:yes stop_codon:yes gene_type:complete